MTRQRWSDEEEAILEAVYPHHGVPGVAEILPHRSPGTIGLRACTNGIRKLPKEERSKKTPHELAAEVRRRLNPPIPKATPKAKRQPETGEKRMAYGPGGVQFEYGTTAGTKAGLEKVPDTATNLPWVSYPRDPSTARAVAAACEYMARASDAVKKVGPEAQRFFESQAAYLRALADRMEQQAPA